MNRVKITFNAERWKKDREKLSKKRNMDKA